MAQRSTGGLQFRLKSIRCLDRKHGDASFAQRRRRRYLSPIIMPRPDARQRPAEHGFSQRRRRSCLIILRAPLENAEVKDERVVSCRKPYRLAAFKMPADTAMHSVPLIVTTMLRRLPADGMARVIYWAPSLPFSLAERRAYIRAARRAPPIVALCAMRRGEARRLLGGMPQISFYTAFICPGGGVSPLRRQRRHVGA